MNQYIRHGEIESKITSMFLKKFSREQILEVSKFSGFGWLWNHKR